MPNTQKYVKAGVCNTYRSPNSNMPHTIKNEKIKNETPNAMIYFFMFSTPISFFPKSASTVRSTYTRKENIPENTEGNCISRNNPKFPRTQEHRLPYF